MLTEVKALDFVIMLAVSTGRVVSGMGRFISGDQLRFVNLCTENTRLASGYV